MQMQIPTQVDRIINTLKKGGFEAYAVGGCVRDTLLGRTPGDWDITTSARPEEVKALFRRTIDTGIEHGTVTIMIDRTGYEVTTYRIDGEYEDGRHPKQVAFTSNLLEDLRRRDFTINAMAYSHETGIVDAFGGMEDLKNRTIRCVGDAMERFTEDALRILRAIRFSAQLDFTIEEKTRDAISVIAPNIAKVSKERIQVELTKLLLSDHPEQMRLVYETGISKYVSAAFAGLPWRKLCVPTELPAEKYVRWAAFLRCAGDAENDGQDETPGERQAGLHTEKTGDVSFHSGQDQNGTAGAEAKEHTAAAECREKAAQTAVRVLRDLKLDNDTIGRVRTLVRWSGVELARPASEAADSGQEETASGSDIECVSAEKMRGEPQNADAQGDLLVSVRRAMSQMEPEVWDALVLLNRYGEEIRQATAQIRAAGDCLDLKHLAVNGQDLIRAGVKPGREMGEILKQLLERVLEEPALNEKETLLAMIEPGTV